MSCGTVLKHDALPKLVHEQHSHTTRRHREHVQTVHLPSSLRRPRPQARPSVWRQHPGCIGQERSAPVGLGRPPPSVAALHQRPAASPWCPKPTRSFRKRLTACGRQVQSVGNTWWRRGGQPPVILDTPAVPKSRSGCRGIGSRLLEHLGQSVDPEALQPVARCTRCS